MPSSTSLQLQGGRKKWCPCFNFAIHRFWPFFHFYNKKSMSHEDKITSATSPLLCNHPT